MSEKRCLDCSKIISSISSRCGTCARKLQKYSAATRHKMSLSRKKFLKDHPEKNNHYKHGLSLFQHYCIDCNKEINWRAKRCKSCESSRRSYSPRFGKDNPSYINGATTKVAFCMDCGKKLNKLAVYKNNKRCISCSKKYSMCLHPETNPWYIDGRSSLLRSIRISKSSVNWRKKIFERDNYTCQKCKKRGFHLEAHHKKRFSKIVDNFLKKYYFLNPIKNKKFLLYLSNSYTPFWDIKNGITLCRKCHDKTKRKNERH